MYVYEHIYTYVYEYIHTYTYIHSYIDHNVIIFYDGLNYIMLCCVCYVMLHILATVSALINQVTFSNTESIAVTRLSKGSRLSRGFTIVS